MFAHPSFDDHSSVTFCNDPASGLRAIIAIHSLAIGPALGGCRLRAYPSEGAALDDALRLSRAMSFKNALGDRPFGGAKAVIIAEPVGAPREQLLPAFGRAVDRLGGAYITAEDAGITPADISRIRTTTRHVRNITTERGGPAPYTAYGMYVAIREAATHVLGRPLHGCSIAIQGLGGVGMDLTERLAREGATLLVADPDRMRCNDAVERLGAAAIAPEDIHAADVDLFAPCAFGGVLNAGTIPRIKARVIAGAANNQLATAEDGMRLVQRGIVYCPDYVINAGGIRATAAPGEAFDHETALRRVEGIGDLLRRIIDEAARTDTPPGQVADRLALARIRAAAASGGWDTRP